MNTESTSTGYDLTSFTPAFVPPAVSMDPAIEASAADTKCRLQMDAFTSDAPIMSNSAENAVQFADHGASDATEIDNALNAANSPTAEEPIDASSTPDSTAEPGEFAGTHSPDETNGDAVIDADSTDDPGFSADRLHPYWVPFGVDLSDWSPELCADIAALINPLYHELVLSAKPGLARSIGTTVVYLSWLEILEQLRIEVVSQASDSVRYDMLLDGDSRPALIGRYLRIVGAKLRFSQFLLQLQEIKTRHEKENQTEPPMPRRRCRSS